MDVSRKVLDAVPGCEVPFAANSAIIKAVKQKFTRTGVKASNEVGIEMDGDGEDSIPGNVCANIASFSINTYEWDPYIGENKAGGTVSINLSSNKQDTQPNSAVVLSIKVDKNNDKNIDYECTFYDENAQFFSQKGCL
jgi:hypothetical protein